MASRNWTDKQKQAIDTRDRTLLISAAAGSGKTATLTERVIRSLLEGDDPLSVTDLLVVTFTTAAAGELRERITAAIRASLRERPDDRRLERELQLLPLAKICTIDSFCNEIVREMCAFVDVPPNYRIADTAEVALIASAIMENLIAGMHTGAFPEVATPEEFLSLTDALVGVRRSDALAATFLYVYEKTLSHEDGVDSLRPLVEEMDPSRYTGCENTRIGGYIVRHAHETVAYYRTHLAASVRTLSSMPSDKFAVRYHALFAPLCVALDALLSAKDYGALGAALASFPYPKMPGGSRRDAPDAVESAISLYKEMKLALTDLSESYFFYTEDEYRALCGALYEKLSVFYRFLSTFDRLFSEEKRARGLCEFSDIERYAYECLWQNGERTEYARSLADRFRAVYIDEYQDVNRLQDRIFAAISTPSNRFMVGDIKQSIYSFRSADPSIFADMKGRMTPIDRSVPEGEAALFMSDNFRCDRGVVELVNSVFDCVFGLVGENIGYCPEDALLCSKYKGRESEEPPLVRAELLLIESKYKKQQNPIDDVAEERRRGIEHEAIAVASRIRELLATEKKNDGTPIRPSDIAILLRSVRGRGSFFVRALREEGIEAVVAEAESFFLSPEILLALCLLNVLDNPTRDVYLSGLLLSPLYGFTPDELFEIRASTEGGTLYRALSNYCAEHPEFEKGVSFLRTLEHYRHLAEGMGVDELLSRLYHETGLFPLAAMNGGRDNLMLLYDYARKFESAGFRGLYAFISYVNNLIENGTTIDNKPEIKPDTNAVRILTIHSSKGLEYPVCFVCNAGAAFRDGDVMRERGTLQFSPGFGLGMRLRDKTGLVSVDNPVNRILAHRRMEEIFDEELRILYVALTRARERLFVSAQVGASVEDYRARIGELRERLSPVALRRLGSYMELILASTPAATVREYRLDSTDDDALPDEESEAFTLPSEVLFVPKDSEDERVRTLVERMTYAYPDEGLLDLPEKLSVSFIHPRILDESDTEGRVENSLDEPKKERKVGIMPDFYTGVRKDEGARRGTATHTVMQFCDFKKLLSDGASTEVERLVRERYLRKEEAALVHLDELEAFRRSSLCRELCEAKRIYRELRFHAKLPASMLTEDEEKRARYRGATVLVQGVIDCILEDGQGNLTLVDYKTDRLSYEERRHPTLAAEALRKKHGAQLTYYAAAVREMFGKAPARTLLYSLHLGDTVEL